MLKKMNIKKIVSWVLGVPAALIACSEAQTGDGVALQFCALATIGAILFANGLLGRKRAYDR